MRPTVCRVFISQEGPADVFILGIPDQKWGCFPLLSGRESLATAWAFRG